MKLIRKIDYNSPVVLTFVILSFLVLIIDQKTGGMANLMLFSVYQSSMTDPFFYIRLFGHDLGHAGWEHYVNNMLLLLVVGPMLEEKYGSRKLLVMILLTAFVTGMVNLLFFQVRVLGASGIVFMMILRSSITSMKEQRIPLTLILVAAAYMGNEITQGIVGQDNISQISHITGGICGIIFGLVYQKKQI